MSGAQERVNAAVAQQNSQVSAIANALLDEKALNFIRGLAPGLDPRSIAMIACAHVKATPALRACVPASIVTAVAEAAKLGLSVDGVLGHAYLVPFKERGTPMAKMMVGYRGIQHLAYQSEKVVRIHAAVIHEHDEYHYAEGVTVEFRHARPKLGHDRGEMVGAYATAHLVGGGPPLIVVMDRAEIEKRRSSSASFKFKAKDSPWTTHPEAMWTKTAIRELGKRIPVPTLQAAAVRDEARDEGRPVPPSAIDLGDADVVPDAVPVTRDHADGTTIGGDSVDAAGPDGACRKCGLLKLRDDGSCPDCEPRQSGPPKEREPGEEG